MTLGATFKSFTQKQIESEKHLNTTIKATTDGVVEAKQNIQNLDNQVQNINTTISTMPNEYVKVNTFDAYKTEVNQKLQDKCNLQDIEQQFVKIEDFEELKTKVEALENNNKEEGGDTT